MFALRENKSQKHSNDYAWFYPARPETEVPANEKPLLITGREAGMNSKPGSPLQPLFLFFFISPVLAPFMPHMRKAFQMWPSILSGATSAMANKWKAHRARDAPTERLDGPWMETERASETERRTEHPRDGRGSVLWDVMNSFSSSCLCVVFWRLLENQESRGPTQWIGVNNEQPFGFRIRMVIVSVSDQS